MRKNTLLASVAALSLFGATSIAAAQTMNQGAPRGAEPPAAAAPKGESTTPGTPPAARQPAQAQPSAPGAKPGPAAQDQKASPQQAQDKPAAQPKAATSPAADSKTTGAAASGTAGAGAPPAEKRGQIASTIKQAKIPAATNVNFTVSVGARVPSSVTFYPIPASIIEIYPEWRGYQVIFVNGRYVIVRPQTYEIVYIIEG